LGDYGLPLSFLWGGRKVGARWEKGSKSKATKKMIAVGASNGYRSEARGPLLTKSDHRTNRNSLSPRVFGRKETTQAQQRKLRRKKNRKKWICRM